jgi:hypothetical protein
VNAVLHRFDLRDPTEQDARAVATRFQPQVIVVIRSAKLEPECRTPEGCDERRIGAVDDDRIPLKRHASEAMTRPMGESDRGQSRADSSVSRRA